MTEPTTDYDQAIADQKKAHHKRIARLLIAIGALLVVVLIFLLLPGAGNVEQATKDQLSAEQAEHIALTAAEKEALRKALMTRLNAYDKTFGELLSNTEFRQWQPQPIDELDIAKNTVLEHFAKGEFPQAEDALSQLETDTRQLQQQWHQAFDQAMIDAQTAFASDKKDDAQVALNNAARVKPSHSAIAELQQRLDVFDTVKDWQNRYQVAIQENNITKQITALQAILRLDPVRTEYQQPLEQRLEQQRQQALANTVEQLNTALDNSQQNPALLAKVPGLLRNAKQLGVSTSLYHTLNERFRQLSKNNALLLSVIKLDTLAGQDDWVAVQRQATIDVKKHPHSRELADYLDSAQRIIKADKSFSRVISSPQRLTEASIRQHVNGLVADYQSLESRSPSLKRQLTRVRELVQLAQTPVNVTLTSDDNTQINIFGLGEQGTLEQKRLRLLPGNYTITGEREGYRSKRQQLTIELGQTDLTLNMVCDERI